MASRRSLIGNVNDDEKDVNVQLQVSVNEFDGASMSNVTMLNKALKITGMWFINHSEYCRCHKNQTKKCNDYMIKFQSFVVLTLSVVLSTTLVIGNFSSALFSFKWDYDVNSWAVIMCCICAALQRVIAQYYFASIRSKSQLVWNYSMVEKTVPLKRKSFEKYIKFLKRFFIVFIIVACIDMIVGYFLAAIHMHSHESYTKITVAVFFAEILVFVIFLLIYLPFYICEITQLAIILKYQLKLNELIDLMHDLNKMVLNIHSNHNHRVTCLRDLAVIVDKIETNWKLEWNNNSCIWQYYTLFSTLMVFCQSWITLNQVIGHTISAQWILFKNDSATNVYWIVNWILPAAPVIILFYFGISINFKVYQFKNLVKKLVISSNNVEMNYTNEKIDNISDNINDVNLNKKFDDWRSYVMIENSKLNFKLFGFQITYTLVFKTILSFLVARILSLVLQYWIQTH